MNEHIKINKGLIEYLLSIPEFSEEELPADLSAEDSLPAELVSFIDAHDRQIALQFQKFIEEIPGGFFIYHAGGSEELIYANQALLRIFQCDTMEEFKELTGNTFRGLVHPDDLDYVEKSIAEQISHSQYDLDYVEYRIIRKDGEVRWVDDYGHFVHSDTVGDIFYVFIGDATEKKNRHNQEKEDLINERLMQEQKLQRKIEEYNRQLEHINLEHLRRLETIEGLSIDYKSIFYADLEADQIQCYRLNNRFTTSPEKERKILPFSGYFAYYIRTWVHPEDRDIVSKATSAEYIRINLAASKSLHVNYRILRNDDTEYIQLRIVNVGGGDTASQIIMGFRSVDEEIIHEIKQKQTLEEALVQANLANVTKNMFLSNMSHDVRTPMNAIVGFTALAKKHIDDREKVKDYLDIIENSSSQLLHLLNDVLEISKIDMGKVYVENAQCSLLEIAQNIQATMLSRAYEKHINLSLGTSGLKHSIVYTDRQKITQILLCLASNAVKYTGEGGQIKIMITEEPDDSKDYSIFHFMVEDNGIGISEKFIGHIFEPFERENNTTLSGVYGTGLGLTITKNLVEMLDGTIEVKSTVGEGSTFTVTLRLLIQNPTQKTSKEAPSISSFHADNQHVLIVEDNEINLEIETELLQDAGFIVDTAVNGRIALDKIKQSKPGDYDLILMDIQMPVMDGYHAARAIRQIADPALCSIPIIALSANAFEEDRKRAEESGMNAHIAKPIDIPQLLSTIREITENADSAANK